MGWWTDHVVPRAVDLALGGDAIGEYRDAACTDLHGTVVELGFGSGMNLPHYPPEVGRILAVEPSDLAWQRARARVAASHAKVERVGLDGARLPLDDASVDGVVSTFTMCSIPDLEAALAEVARVLRPGGRLQFVEHGLAPDERVNRWQARLDPWQQRLAGGCHLTRPIAELVTASGLALEPPRSEYVGWPRSFTYVTQSRATRNAAREVP